MEIASASWPQALSDLPMDGHYKARFRAHWKSLHEDFKIMSDQLKIGRTHRRNVTSLEERPLALRFFSL